jgi:hydroxymethylpyrimidine pyrophosphatase-like HAD family hydrolase
MQAVKSPETEIATAHPSPLYRLLFLDLDGTLVGKDDVVSPRTIAALNRAREQGCTPVICTARNRYMVQHIAAQWHGHGYAILSNGAIIAEWESGRVLQKIVLSSRLVSQAARVAHSLQASALCFGVHAEEDGGECIYTDRHFAQPDRYLARNANRLVYRDSLESAEDLQPVGIGAYGPREQAESLARAWQDTLGPAVSVFAAPDPKYDCWCAFLNASDADKAHAAARVAEMLGVPREQAMAVGDHVNDLGLLRWAGLGVCMGDGHEEARACAAHVTGTLAEDGAAQAIERFVLGTGDL